jgi:hypothetical protein
MIRRYVLSALVLGAAIVAGCAGGSTGGGPVPGAQTSASPTPASNVLFFAIPNQAGTLSLPLISNITPAFGFQAGAPSGLTLNATESTSAPGNAPAPSSMTRKSASVPAGTTPFLYLTVKFSADVPSGVLASEILNLSGTLSTGLNVFCEIDDITSATATKIGTLGPVALTSTAVFANPTTDTTLTGGHTYLFQFYTEAVVPATPTPSPSPTASGATPTPSPSPTGNASPTPSPVPTVTSAGTATAPPVFAFGGPVGSTATVTPPTVPGPLVPAVGAGGYGTHAAHVSIQLGAATTTAAYSMSGALGSVGDLPGNFPFYTGSAATPLFYIQLTPSAAVSFSQLPAIAVTVNSFGSNNTCSLFIYANTGGSAYQWVQVPSTLVNVSGTSVSIPAASSPVGTSVNYSPTSAQVGFIGC